MNIPVGQTERNPGISMLYAKVFPKWVSITLIGSILALGVLSPYAETPQLRVLYSLLIGVGPIAIGYSLYVYPRNQ